ncbi:MAG: hypothetical protein SGI98_11550 [Verrucomicrobiota bacterium]|nr:hypothetical protein [Verrucomicrobiota bacterium]
MKFQFMEKGSDNWDYEREPELHDWEDLLDALERRYSRKQATDQEITFVKNKIIEIKKDMPLAG